MLNLSALFKRNSKGELISYVDDNADINIVFTEILCSFYRECETYEEKIDLRNNLRRLLNEHDIDEEASFKDIAEVEINVW